MNKRSERRSAGDTGDQQSMNEHPHESLPAFALGALDADEAVQVTQHLSGFPTCRDHADTFSTVVGLLPHATAPRNPPAPVKHQLLALVAGVAAASGGAGVRARRRLRWMGVGAAR